MTSLTKIKIRLNVPHNGKVVVHVRAGDLGHKELEEKHQHQLK
jgi:hypothetical protein